MKKIILLCLVSFSACVPQQAFKQAETNALLCDMFVKNMDEGFTSREQEQKFIKANRNAWHAQNFALNDAPLPTDLETATRPFAIAVITSETK